ncbi:MAG: SRPBCC family protein [Paracoccaceae bacterium]|nr:SRPBCC family protein [Paracoccaceae bacterium]
MRKWVFTLVLAAATLGAGGAQAHGPVRQKITLEIKLDATPDEVWAVIGNFQDMSWLPPVAKTEGEGGNVPEATRVLTLNAPGDPKIVELLDKYSAEKRSYSYRITEVDVAVLPVTNYSSHITVKDDGGKALVEWRGAFYRGYPNNDPPENLNDAAAIAAVTGVYQTGLDALAARFGKRE